MDYDIIVIGAGHNALVSAAYLAQAGLRIGVFEKRPRVGGAVATEEIVDGYRFDLGGSAHILIRLTPIVSELNLDRYGLEYIDLDPLFFSPFPDGQSIIIYRDLERTVSRLEGQFPGEGEAYKRFVEDWRPFAQAVRNAFLESPSPFQLAKAFALGPSSKLDWTAALPTILRPYGQVVDQYFTSERLKATLTWMAAQSGPPPSEPLSAPFLLWHPLYHDGGIARPRGGSGMLTQALRAHIEDHGGEVHTGTAVDEILIRGETVQGVRVHEDIFTSPSVLAGTHILESMGRLLPPDKRPLWLNKVRVGNGFGAILRLALSKTITYKDHPKDEARMALQLICRNRQQIGDAYADYLRGDPTSDPPIVAMTFSAIDDSLAPPGGEVLWLWAQYYPYELSRNRSWDEIGPGVARRILDTFEQYAPGTRDSVVGELFQHPLWLERELGLCRGNVMHLEMSVDQMFMMRPDPSVSGYRSHLKGLYLTGASTHPGGGIMGASGRNAARVILQDLSRRLL